MRVFVTGGSGFIGRHLIQHLRTAGHTVLALARSESAEAVVRKAGAESVRGDLSQREVLAEAMRGCEIAFHAAASTAEWDTWEHFLQANVEGTENVVAAARAAGVRRVVHVSTEAVLLDGNPLVDADETRPIPEAPIRGYAASKAMAERAALNAAGDSLEVVVVRPRLVWGPDDTSLLDKIAAAARAGRFAWIGGGAALTSTCHVTNLCHALLLAAERGRSGEVYFITDGPPATYRAFLTELLATRGVEAGTRSLPLGVAKLGASLVEGTWRLLGLRRPPPLQRTSVFLLGQQMTVSDAKARRELGYSPLVTREEGLAALRG